MTTAASPYDPPTEISQEQQPAGDVKEWGIAAIVIAALLFVTSPMTLLLAVGIWGFADRGSNVVLLHAWLARLGIALVAVLCVISVAFAYKSFRIVSATGGSWAIPITASVLSAFATLMWVITAIALLNTTESMLLLYSR